MTDPGPFKTNEQRAIDYHAKQASYEKRGSGGYQGKNPMPQSARQYPDPRGETPVVDLRVYQPSKPPSSRPYEAPVPVPYQLPILGTDPRGYMNTVPNYMPIAYQPMQNVTLDFNGINTDYARMHRAMEDLLPERDTLDTMTTVSERRSLKQYVRTVFIKTSDGEMTSLADSKDATSLLARLKFTDLNPYHLDAFSRNPLSSLPYGFLIYRSAYPLRVDLATSSVRAARDSTGMNIRMYRMSVAEVRARNSGTTKDSDMWREIDWYQSMRQNVLLKNVSPHLAMLYCWMVSVCAIDWDALAKAGTAPVGTAVQTLERAVTRRRADMVQPKSIAELTAAVAPSTTTPLTNLIQPYPGKQLAALRQQMGQSTDPSAVPAFTTPLAPLSEQMNTASLGTIDVDNVDSGYCVVALTDGFTHNLVAWASIQYAENFHHAKMVQTGYHEDSTWFNVLFQVLHAMHAMQISAYAFDDMSMSRNFYIKDLKIDPNTAAGYWRYRIGGIDYYLPNLGYLVLLDSGYQDAMSARVGGAKPVHKIYRVDADSGETADTVRARNHANLVTLLTTSFGGEFKNRNGVKFSKTVEDWVTGVGASMVSTTPNQPPTVAPTVPDFEQLFYLHCRRFMNNRIGTYIKVSERSHLRDGDVRTFVRGQLVAREVSYDTWIWCMFIRTVLIDKDPDVGVRRMAVVLTKNTPSDDSIIEAWVSLETLVPYAATETVMQDFDPDKQRLADDQILETYTS